MKILCSISTKNRYDVLPMAMQSIVNQTRRPDEFVLYDDNDKPIDIRSIPACLYLLQMFDAKGIKWHVEVGSKAGQHHNHQRANLAKGFDAIWRLDDDCVAEPNVLARLAHQLEGKVGAVGGSIIVPPMPTTWLPDASSSIDRLDKPNEQWFPIRETHEVDHLHCSFLYRPGIVNYDVRLSKKAHREETMFTYALKLAGYKILVTPCITWHLRAMTGGIRSDNDIKDYEHDEWIFQKWLEFKKSGKTLYILNGGLGDNYMFLQAIKPKPKSVVATCYPDLFKGMGIEIISIADAWNITNVESHNIYGWCGQNDWKGHLIDAYKEFYEDINLSRK